MTTFREEWESLLDELETESSHLLEQLDGAGIDLPSVYKLIEGQVRNGCRTQAWRNRTHWVGSQVTNDVAKSIADAEKQLQNLRPVRKRHGKVLEEGASGYLRRKLTADDNNEAATRNGEMDWSSFNKLFSGQTSEEAISFGSKHWASVYLASTPQQAAAMGIKFPGIDEVEEFDEIDQDVAGVEVYMDVTFDVGIDELNDPSIPLHRRTGSVASAKAEPFRMSRKVVPPKRKHGVEEGKISPPPRAEKIPRPTDPPHPTVAESVRPPHEQARFATRIDPKDKGVYVRRVSPEPRARTEPLKCLPGNYDHCKYASHCVVPMHHSSGAAPRITNYPDPRMGVMQSEDNALAATQAVATSQQANLDHYMGPGRCYEKD